MARTLCCNWETLVLWGPRVVGLGPVSVAPRVGWLDCAAVSAAAAAAAAWDQRAPHGVAALPPPPPRRPVRGQCLSGRCVVASQPADCGGPGSAVSCSPRLNWDWCEHVLPCTPPSPAADGAVFLCVRAIGQWSIERADVIYYPSLLCGRAVRPPRLWFLWGGRAWVFISWHRAGGKPPPLLQTEEGPRISSRGTCVCSQPNEQAQGSTVVVAAATACTQVARERLAVQLLCCCQLAERILLPAASVSAHLSSLSCALASSMCKACYFLFPRAVLKSSDKLVAYRVQLFSC